MLIMTFNVQTNASLIHEIANISLPWKGDNIPRGISLPWKGDYIPPPPRLGPVASLPALTPLLKGSGYASGTPPPPPAPPARLSENHSGVNKIKSNQFR